MGKRAPPGSAIPSRAERIAASKATQLTQLTQLTGTSDLTLTCTLTCTLTLPLTRTVIGILTGIEGQATRASDLTLTCTLTSKAKQLGGTSDFGVKILVSERDRGGDNRESVWEEEEESGSARETVEIGDDRLGDESAGTRPSS